MARTLVTGAGGFIGKHLVRALLARSDEVHALVRDTSSSLPQGVQVHGVDIADRDALREVMMKAKPEQVIHLAASNVRAGITASADEVVRTNVLGTHALLEESAAHGVRAFVGMGSFLEYGAKQGPVREDMLCAPPELYSVSKLAATLLAQSYGRSLKLHTVMLRLFTPYGPGMQEKRLVREALERAQRGEPLSLTSPTVARDFIYIDDIVALLIEAAEKAAEYRGEIFNLGSGEKTSLEEFAQQVLETTGSSSAVDWGVFGAVSYDSEFWQADMTKTFEAFSWRPKTTLAEGLERTAQWLRSVGG